MTDNESTETEQLLQDAAADYAKHNSEETVVEWKGALGSIYATNLTQKEEGTA